MGRVNSYADQAIVGSYASLVVPSDTVDLDPTYHRPFRIYVGGAGVVTFLPARGQTSIAITVNAGSSIPIWVRRVLATGTTATLMVAYY
jgi:hypothetical protein